MKLAHRVVLVTGGASGIGRAAALALAREGAIVVVSDVNVIGGGETVSAVRHAGGEALFIAADVSQAGQVAHLVERAVSVYGRLDCAVNNAGIGGDRTPTHEREESAWDTLMNINLKGVWLCMKYEIAAMLAGGGGAIVNMASAAGLIGFAYASAYCASKHGVVGLTRAAALEYARRGIRVNAICPGFTETPMVEALRQDNARAAEASFNAIPMRRLGTPDEIAQAVVWLCSDDSSFVTGHALAVDGGTVIQ